MSGRSPVMIMAGGTGGHVFPALAVAECLRERDVQVVWVGTHDGLEARLVPAQFTIEWLTIAGLRRSGVIAVLLFPWRLLRALLQAWRILGKWRPSVVLGMGGFVSGPGGLVAWLRRIPLVIHEQNAIPGFTNRVLARVATRTLEAVPGSFRSVPAVHTGNPVRPAITALAPPAERFAGRSETTRVLVLGGSRGAAVFNEVMPSTVARLPAGTVSVWHQTGHHELAARVAPAYQGANVEARCDPFIDDMAAAYAWAHLVVCRAGAITIAELASVGVGAILVPYPHAVDDHQSANARVLVDAGAAMLVPQSELNADRLAGLLAELAGRPVRLLEMAQAARALAMPQAAHTVGELCLEVAD